MGEKGPPNSGPGGPRVLAWVIKGIFGSERWNLFIYYYYYLFIYFQKVLVVFRQMSICLNGLIKTLDRIPLVSFVSYVSFVGFVSCVGCVRCVTCVGCVRCVTCVSCVGCVRCVTCVGCVRCVTCVSCVYYVSSVSFEAGFISLLRVSSVTLALFLWPSDLGGHIF